MDSYKLVSNRGRLCERRYNNPRRQVRRKQTCWETGTEIPLSALDYGRIVSHGRCLLSNDLR
jgi:hypothetical protein